MKKRREFLSLHHLGPRLDSAHSLELELELIQSHMAQKPMLRGEVGARARVIRALTPVRSPYLMLLSIKPLPNPMVLLGVRSISNPPTTKPDQNLPQPASDSPIGSGGDSPLEAPARRAIAAQLFALLSWVLDSPAFCSWRFFFYWPEPAW